MSELVQTEDLHGTVIRTWKRYDVAGTPSMPYTQYAVKIDGKTSLVSGPYCDDPKYARFAIGDTIPITRKTYETPIGSRYTVHEVTSA